MGQPYCHQFPPKPGTGVDGERLYALKAKRQSSGHKDARELMQHSSLTRATNMSTQSCSVSLPVPCVIRTVTSFDSTQLPQFNGMA